MKIRHYFLGPALLLISNIHAGDAKSQIQPALGWEWSFSGGPSWHYMGDVSFSGRTRSQSLILPTFVGSDSLTVPPVGNEDSIGDRFYNDGYVRQDDGTGFDGSTWYWGYDNASQVQGGNLIYQATGYQSIRTDIPVTSPGLSSTRDLRDAGVEFRADVLTPWTLGPFRVGGMISFGFVSDDQSFSFSNHSTTQIREDYRLDYVDTYELGGVVPPAAPYQGSLGGPGPLISNIPSLRAVTPVLVNTDIANFNNVVSANFSDEVFGFTAGPALIYQEGPWNLVLSAGVILEFHRYKVRQMETLKASQDGLTTTFARWSDEESGLKLRPGLFIQAGVGYELGNDWQLSGFVRGETAADFNVSAGRSEFVFDPQGCTIGLQIGVPF